MPFLLATTDSQRLALQGAGIVGMSLLPGYVVGTAFSLAQQAFL